METHAATKKRISKAARGLVCDACGGGKWRVVYTRGRREQVVQRRRECKACGKRITTWERKIGRIPLKSGTVCRFEC